MRKTKKDYSALLPCEFPEQTQVLVSKGGHYGNLPVFMDGMQVISCWRMSWRLRIKALLLGRVWVSVRTSTKPPPIWLAIERTAFLREK